MANVFFEQENADLLPPLVKIRQRLQSAPDNLLKTPARAKNIKTPLQSARKALGTVNNASTPSVNVKKASTPSVLDDILGLQKLSMPQEEKVKVTQNVSDEYPDIEEFSPYDPLEFQKYCVPEDLVMLGDLPLAGLACLPHVSVLHEEPEKMIPFDTSRVRMPERSGYSPELDDFLHTLSTLTIEFPPEPCTF